MRPVKVDLLHVGFQDIAQLVVAFGSVQPQCGGDLSVGPRRPSDGALQHATVRFATLAFGNREALRRIGIQLGQVLTDLAAVKQQLADQQHAIDCPPRAGRGEPRLPLWRRGPLRSSPRRRG